MDSIQERHSVERLVNRLRLAPLIESCATVWPSKLDIELMLPKYEEDLLTLGKHIPLLLERIHDNDNFHILLITCLYESTAFILSEELADIQKAIRKDYVWDYLLSRSEGKLIVSSLFKYYRKVLLNTDWIFNFGDLTSFWSFSWDLLEYEATQNIFLDRDNVAIIEKVCFNLIKSNCTQLCIKGVTIIEECIHKTRGLSLIDYETVYSELMTQIWRLFEDDERNQQISIVLFAALLECVKVIEVDRNQLSCLIKDYRRWGKADTLMDILIRSLEGSENTTKTLFLLEQVILLLTIDHPNIRIPELPDLDLINSDCTENEAKSAMPTINDSNKMSSVPEWWAKAQKCVSGRFHRWSMKLLQMIVVEVEKIENSNTLYFQYLACILFFIVDCPGVTHNANSRESFKAVVQLMVNFLETGAKHLDHIYTKRQPTSPLYSSYAQFFSASVTLVKEFMDAMISNNEKLTELHDSKRDTIYDYEQILSLNEVSKNARNWLQYASNPQEHTEEI